MSKTNEWAMERANRGRGMQIPPGGAQMSLVGDGSKAFLWVGDEAAGFCCAILSGVKPLLSLRDALTKTLRGVTK